MYFTVLAETLSEADNNSLPEEPVKFSIEKGARKTPVFQSEVESTSEDLI
jgi:hypothetical protein